MRGDEVDGGFSAFALGYGIHTQAETVEELRAWGNHEVIPSHSPIKVGTLSAVLKRVASHHRMTVEELLSRLDL